MSKQRSQNTASYAIGLILAILLTNAAFILVGSKLLSGWPLVFALTGLAICQLWVQLRYFLHLGDESRPRWNLLAFLFAAVVICILVFGSLWIMKNLHYNMMPDMNENIDREIMEKENIYR